MKAAFFSIFISSTITAISALCQGCIEDVCYTRTAILKGYQLSGQLAIDRTDNILYFHFEDSHNRDFTGSLTLNNIRFRLLPEFRFTFAHAVDQSSHDVYMSGPTGIKTFNPYTNVTTDLGLTNKTIWHLQYKDKLYYSEFIKPGLFTYKNKESKGINALSDYIMEDFIIDKKGDIYFTSNGTIHRLKSGANKAENFVDKFYTLTTDKDGNAYFTQPVTRGIYKLDYGTDKLTEVGAFGSGNPFRVVFDSDNNLIYQDIAIDELFFLSPNNDHCRLLAKGKE